MDWTWTCLWQLVVAAAAGAVVGFLREMKGKPAGTTTITLVTVCATLLMQLSYRLPAGTGPSGFGDPARLAAAVITGVGFLGAGTIIRRHGHVDGLTSAATIWIMSAVGLALGAGYYVPAALVLVVVVLGFAVNFRVERLVQACRRRWGINVPPEKDEEPGDPLL